MADTPTTPSTNIIIDWLRETVQRLKTKNPKYFSVIVTIGAIATFFTGLPQLVASIEALHIVLPEWLAAIQSPVVAVAGLVAAFIAKLTVQPTPVVVTEERIVSEARAEQLPFTVKAEAKDAAKEKADNFLS